MTWHISLGGRAKDVDKRMSDEKKNFKDNGGGGHEEKGLNAVSDLLTKLASEAGEAAEVSATADGHSNGNELTLTVRATVRYPRANAPTSKKPSAQQSTATPKTEASQSQKPTPPPTPASKIGQPVTGSPTSAARTQDQAAASTEDNKIAGTGPSTPQTPIK